MTKKRTTNRWFEKISAETAWAVVRSVGDRRLGLAALAALVLAVVLTLHLLPESFHLEEGQPAPRDFKAPREIIDVPETERRRQEAVDRVAEVFTEDPAVSVRVTQAIEEAFRSIRQIQERNVLEESLRMAQLRDQLGLRLTDEVARAILTASDADVRMMEEGALATAEELLAEGIREDRLDNSLRGVAERVRELSLNLHYERFVTVLLQDTLEPNLFFDEAATAAAREQARQEVAPVIIRQNQILIREGEPIRAEDLVRLKDAGILRTERGWWPTAVGAGLLATLWVGLLMGYVARYHSDVYASGSRIGLVGLISLGSLFASIGLLPISEYAAPVATASMLLAILIEPRIAVFATVLLAAMVAVLSGPGLKLFVILLAGGVVGVISVTRVGQRADLMRAGAYVGLTHLVTILAWSFLLEGMVLGDVAFWRDVFWGIVGGLLSAILTTGLLPFLENHFHIMTSVRLLELANPNQPLLRRLLLEAPGTYHHSIMVANLSEAAAEQVGADSLLARVGGYYHDIGKIRRPYFFIENQFGGSNPHEKLAPNLSALIVTAHVKDGVEMAEEYGLPEPLIRFIREHHGTTTAEFFYQKALEEQKEKGVLEENFRYPGPRPQSKETALCMLADACEGAVRAMAKPTRGRIEGTVRRIIRDRLNSGQLDRCDLTLADLDRIAETFTQVLSGLFHSRVEYPESVLKELEKNPGTLSKAVGNESAGGG